MEDRVNPIRITDKTGILGSAGEVYELDFSRDTALYAVEHGIDVAEENTSKRLACLPMLFFCSFRKGYKRIPKEKIDKLREGNHGFSIEFVARLYALLSQALASNVINTDEGYDEKNGLTMDVELD